MTAAIWASAFRLVSNLMATILARNRTHKERLPELFLLSRHKTYRLSGWFEKSGERSLSPLIAIYDNWLINYFQKMGGTPSANINCLPLIILCGSGVWWRKSGG